jgi:5-methylcytosine-specific restriction enzyme subunit McrC
MASRVLELKEETLERLSRSALYHAEAIELSNSGKFDVELASSLNNYTYGIRSRGWVGHIPVGDDLIVRVLPKVPVGNLFRMLDVAYKLRSFHIFEGNTDIESIEDLYERIVSILARRVIDRARKGLYRTYTGLDEELSCVRGRLDAVGTILNIGRGIARLPCSYEEHTADIDENRILEWTLYEVRRQAIRQPKIRHELDQARRALTGSITLERKRATECVGRLYNRLNDDYEPIHGLCRFILEQSGPGIAAGDRSFVPFVLNMPRLFEGFVAEWLRQHPPPGVVVRPKHSVTLNADFRLKIETDILLIDETTNRPLAVLDTKYTSGDQPSEADIYQVAFYARELQVQRGMLVYPSQTALRFCIHHGKDILLESVIFDLSAPLEEAGQAFHDQLFRHCRTDYA